MTEVIYENRDLVIVNKVSGLPTAPLKGQSADTLLSRTGELFPEILKVKGFNEWEGGLIHRLDTPTSGLVMFARTQKAFDSLLVQQRKDEIIKVYRARVTAAVEVLPGFIGYCGPDPLSEPALITSSFRPFGPKGASVRPLPAGEKGNAVYTTECVPEGSDSVLCTITRGFRHQIRCHLAWTGHPLLGDVRYGAAESSEFGLEAIELSFINPSDGVRLNITL